jgi:hypothetical protein
MADWTASYIPYVDGYDAGLGVLRSTGEPRNKSIKGQADGVTLSPGGSGLTWVTRVDSTEALETEFGITASARGGIGIFKADDKFEFTKRCQLQSYSLAVIIRSEQQSGFIQIDELELTEAAKVLASANPEGFVDQFGDCFIRGIKRGGQLFISIRIDTRDMQSKETIKNSLNATVGAFSAEAMVSLTEAVKSTNSHSEVLLFNIGGIAAPTSLSSPVLGPWINSVTTQAAPFAVTLAPYKIVSGFDPPQAAELQHQQDILLRCEQLRYYALDSLNEVEYVLSHLNLFATVDVAALNTARTGFAVDIDVISQARAFATRNPIQAMEPESYARTKLLRPDYKLTLLPVPMPELPATLLKVPNFVGWLAEDLVFGQGGIPNYFSVEELSEWGPRFGQTEVPEPWPRDVCEFLAAFRIEFTIDPNADYVPQGQNFVTSQEPGIGALVSPRDKITLHAGGHYEGPWMPESWRAQRL